MADGDDDEVGYGKPPKHSRFKKGQSGNPKGRRPKSRNTSTLLAEELEKKITVKDGNSERRLSKREVLIARLVHDGLSGKSQAMALLLKILEVEAPVDPFVADEQDEHLLEEWLLRNQNGKVTTDEYAGEADQQASYPDEDADEI